MSAEQEARATIAEVRSAWLRALLTWIADRPFPLRELFAILLLPLAGAYWLLARVRAWII